MEPTTTRGADFAELPRGALAEGRRGCCSYYGIEGAGTKSEAEEVEEETVQMERAENMAAAEVVVVVVEVEMGGVQPQIILNQETHLSPEENRKSGSRDQCKSLAMRLGQPEMAEISRKSISV
uniref:Uncharacterized protein n=1 Tax=Solanum lycopersicum TaxID=4081 RepID=A0A3Q7FIY0_SOLLC